MNGKQTLVRFAGTKLTQDEYDFVEEISQEKKWSVAQVLREAIKDKMNKKAITSLSEKINELFYQGYFDEFLEDLALNEPELFKEYTNSQEAIATCH